ncbi:hypothetical protein C8J57DRAFT_1231184 [Mycena rebaudengoi]|nr:hypothetical protein C8J57DRAFT_1231184 [Mycena rebaudengoi]
MRNAEPKHCRNSLRAMFGTTPMSVHGCQTIVETMFYRVVCHRGWKEKVQYLKKKSQYLCAAYTLLEFHTESGFRTGPPAGTKRQPGPGPIKTVPNQPAGLKPVQVTRGAALHQTRQVNPRYPTEKQSEKYKVFGVASMDVPKAKIAVHNGSAFGTRSRFVSSDARGPSNFDNEQDAGVEALSTFTLLKLAQLHNARPAFHRSQMVRDLMLHTCNESFHARPSAQGYPVRDLPVLDNNDTDPIVRSLDNIDVLPLMMSNDLIVDENDGFTFEFLPGASEPQVKENHSGLNQINVKPIRNGITKTLKAIRLSYGTRELSKKLKANVVKLK